MQKQHFFNSIIKIFRSTSLIFRLLVQEAVPGKHSWNLFITDFIVVKYVLKINAIITGLHQYVFQKKKKM